MAGIYTKLADVMQDVGSVGKNGYNQQQGFAFRSVDDTVLAVHEAMIKHRVLILPEVVNVEQAQREGISKAGHPQITTNVRVTVAYTFAAEDGSMVTTSAVGEGSDFGDKATSKAMSMALKYALFQTFLIPTGDADPDSETVHASGQTSPQQQRAPQQGVPERVKAAAGDKFDAKTDERWEIIARAAATGLNDFVKDIYEKGEKWDLTEKQVAGAFNAATKLLASNPATVTAAFPGATVEPDYDDEPF